MEPEAESTATEPSSPGAAQRAFFQPPALHLAPPLAMLASIAAVLDLLLRRGLLRTLSGELGRSETRALGPWLELPMNLTAIAGTFAVTIGLFELLASRFRPAWRPAPLMVRIAEAAMRAVTAGFAGILLPSIFIATFFPVERTTGPAVFAAASAAYLLVLQVSFLTTRIGGPRSLRAAMTLVAVSAVSGFLALVVGELGPQIGWAGSYEVYQLVSLIGELSFLVVPVALLSGIIPARRERRALVAFYVGATLGLVAMLAFDTWRASVGPSYEAILYGALRFEVFLGRFGLVYAVPFGLFAGAGVGALLSSRPAHRQLGAASLALLASGFGPRTPAQLLMMVLGATLLGRTLVAEALAKTHGE